MIKTDNFYCLLIRGTNLTKEEKTHIADIYTQYGKDGMLQLLTKKKILPFGAKAFVECDLDTGYWSDILCSFRERNRNILYFLNEAYKVLEKYGVRKMFVSENFGALLSCDGDIGLFSSGDIDNYADPAEKQNIYAAMEELGCTRKERFAVQHQIAAEFYPPESYHLPEKFYLSVDFYPLARLKLPCFIHADDFVDWNNMRNYADSHIHLAPADALTYICMLHISLHSFSRAPDIRLYIDLLNMWKAGADYDVIAAWCRRDKTVIRAGTACAVSNKLMKTAYPDSITNASKRIPKVMKKVFDAQKNDLIYEPSPIKILCIECLCDDRSNLHGLHDMLFPDRAWISQTYGKNGMSAYLKHWKRLL